MSFWQREHEREMQALKETHETLNADKEKGLAEKSQDVARLQVSTMVDEHKTNGTSVLMSTHRSMSPELFHVQKHNASIYNVDENFIAYTVYTKYLYTKYRF